MSTTITRFAVAAAAVLLLAGSAPSAEAATGRIKGTAADEAGSPVADLKIRFVPADQSGNRPRTVKTDRKGRFSHAFFPTGTYRLELEDTDQFVKSLALVEYDEQGVEINRAKGAAHPEEGPPPFRIGFGHRVEMEIVVASAEYRDELEQKVTLGEVSGELKKIQEHYDAGDMQGVLDGTAKLLKEKPNLGVAHYLRGLAQSRQGDTKGAIESLRRGEELAPEQKGIPGALGTVLLQQGRKIRDEGLEDEAEAHFAEAESALSREIDRFGASADYLANRAAVLEELGRTDELIEALGKLIEADPSNGEARLKLVDVQTTAERFADALATLQAISEGDRRTAMSAYNLAAGCYNADDFAGAIAASEKGLAFDAELAPLYRILGRAHLANGENESALQAFRKFVTLAPDDPDAEFERELIRRLEQ